MIFDLLLICFENVKKAHELTGVIVVTGIKAETRLRYRVVWPAPPQMNLYPRAVAQEVVERMSKADFISVSDETVSCKPRKDDSHQVQLVTQLSNLEDPISISILCSGDPKR
jgi:hypothetical protein